MRTEIRTRQNRPQGHLDATFERAAFCTSFSIVVEQFLPVRVGERASIGASGQPLDDRLRTAELRRRLRRLAYENALAARRVPWRPRVVWTSNRNRKDCREASTVVVGLEWLPSRFRQPWSLQECRYHRMWSGFDRKSAFQPGVNVARQHILLRWSRSSLRPIRREQERLQTFTIQSKLNIEGLIEPFNLLVTVP